jgi:hypothetical protein
MLLALSSPKGGSGTSVVAAALALTMAAGRPGVCLADCCGDQPALLGLASEPVVGLADWLATAPDAPAESLERLAIDAGAGVDLLPLGEMSTATAPAEAGTCLGNALESASALTVADLGTAADAARVAIRDAASMRVLVVRACYLSLRRAVRDPATTRADGVVVVEERGRALGVKEVADVLALPVLSTVPVRPEIARVVDAGVLVTRPPEALVVSTERLVTRLGLSDTGRAA